jgi:hypothetical protein
MIVAHEVTAARELIRSRQRGGAGNNEQVPMDAMTLVLVAKMPPPQGGWTVRAGGGSLTDMSCRLIAELSPGRGGEKLANTGKRRSRCEYQQNQTTMK